MLLSDFARPKGAKDRKPRKERSDKGKKRNAIGKKLLLAGGLAAGGGLLGRKLAGKKFKATVEGLKKNINNLDKRKLKTSNDLTEISKSINKTNKDIQKNIKASRKASGDELAEIKNKRNELEDNKQKLLKKESTKSNMRSYLLDEINKANKKIDNITKNQPKVKRKYTIAGALGGTGIGLVTPTNKRSKQNR